MFLFSEHGSLTIVRRSNSRKDNLGQAPFSADQQPQSHHRSPADFAAFDFDSVETTIENFQFTDDFEDMQSTSSAHAGDARCGTSVNDLESDHHHPPAVDTPDACDKAALR